MLTAESTPITAVLDHLAAIGLPIEAHDGNLWAPPGASSRQDAAGLLAELKARKVEALAVLEKGGPPSPTSGADRSNGANGAEDLAPGPCVVCRVPATNLYCFACWRERLARRGRRPS